MPDRQPDQQLAAKVLLEIIRRSAGDEIEGKTRLFKAFYFAHLYYAKRATDYLTDWRIVKMPQGPGIDQFDVLLRELVDSGALDVEPIQIGPYPSVVFRATETPYDARELSTEALNAIRDAAEFIAGKKGSQLSDLTHDRSKSWRDSEFGQEMPIYLDLLSDEEYESAIKKTRTVEEQVAAAWGE